MTTPFRKQELLEKALAKWLQELLEAQDVDDC